MEKRSQWQSNFGFILAAAGSAVGLGNIWKFPGKAYEGGGATFILIYILIVLALGVTLMLTEFAVGRHSHKNCVGAVKALNPKWKFVGGMGVLTSFLIMCYYSHVGGWVMKYMLGYLTEPGNIYADPKGYFYEFLGTNGFPWQAAIIFPAIFMAIAVLILIRGIDKGIERASKILMPALFITIIIIAIRSVTLPGAAEGIKYLTHVDLSTINPSMIMTALAQAFFSLSLGMGIMCTYGSYLNKRENLVKNTITICSLDTLVALIAGFAIIPAVFAAGVEPGMGASFAFISLSTVFQSMAGGWFFGFLFYTLLFFAALTSAISLIEVSVAYICEEKKTDRTKTTIILAVIMVGIGILYTCSQVALPIKGIWLDGAGFTLISFGDFMEFIPDKILIPLGGILFCIFVGWIWGSNKAIAEIEQDGLHKFPMKKAWSIMIKFVVPLIIIIIMLGEFGIIKF